MHDLPPGLLEPATLGRLRRAAAGQPEARRLALGDLRPGDIGVVEAVVRQVHPVRPYDRRRGGTGLLCRVTLADATGEADLLLWDEETRQVQDGPFSPGTALRIQGASVRAGRRGDAELALGAAVVAPLPPAPPAGEPTGDLLCGTLVGVGPTRVAGDPPHVRFQADVEVEAAGGRARVALEGELVKAVRQLLPGAPLVIEGVQPHPLLDGWWLAGPAARLRRPGWDEAR